MRQNYYLALKGHQLLSKTEVKYLYDFIDKAPLDTIFSNGAKGTKIQVRFMTDLPLNGQKDSLIVNWVEIIESDKKGKQLYKNCFVTNLSVTRTNALSIALAGRV